MCGICTKSIDEVFGRFDVDFFPSTEEERPRLRAKQLKQLIRSAEDDLKLDREMYGDGCALGSIALEALRVEQYELSRKF